MLKPHQFRRTHRTEDCALLLLASAALAGIALALATSGNGLASRRLFNSHATPGTVTSTQLGGAATPRTTPSTTND